MNNSKINRLIHSSRTKSAVLTLFRIALLVGLSFVILYPYIAKIASVFMSPSDLYNPIVWLVPMQPTLDNVRNVLKYSDFWTSFTNTLLISLMCAVLQLASTVTVAYGLAKFNFRLKKLLIVFVVLMIVIPPQILYVSLYTKYRYFDWFEILKMLGISRINLLETPIPLALLSATALGLKNGLYILIFMQLFRGLPKELSEAAYVDGAGVFRTFWQINLPQIKAMMVSVFILIFAWQWTDTFYSNIFFKKLPVLSNVVSQVTTITYINAVNNNSISATMVNTAVVMIILPLIIFYIFGQRALVQGFERSGLVG